MEDIDANTANALCYTTAQNLVTINTEERNKEVLAAIVDE